jgi:hypothetical protein
MTLAFCGSRGRGDLAQSAAVWPRSVSDRVSLAEMLANGLFRSYFGSPYSIKCEFQQ